MKQIQLGFNKNVKSLKIFGNKIYFADGKNVGDEIACGTEHFYVIDNDSKSIRMLSKYNLNIGVTIYKEKMDNIYLKICFYNLYEKILCGGIKEPNSSQIMSLFNEKIF